MKRFVKIAGISTMFALSLLMMLTFLDAYASPSKTTRVFVNFFGEAEIEMLFLAAIALLQAAAFLMLMKETRDERKYARN